MDNKNYNNTLKQERKKKLTYLLDYIIKVKSIRIFCVSKLHHHDGSVLCTSTTSVLLMFIFHYITLHYLTLCMVYNKNVWKEILFSMAHIMLIVKCTLHLKIILVGWKI